MIAVLSVFQVNSVFASTDPVLEAATKVVEQAYPGSEMIKVNRIENSDLYAAHFNYNNERFVAYVNPDGAIEATVRNIGKDKLPVLVSHSLHARYVDFNIVKIEELTTNTQTSYVMLLVNQKSMVKVQYYPDGSCNQLEKNRNKPSLRAAR